ncbi:ATP-dependent helicase Lhr and Lhr-like helicase [Quadrisphaera granulorum]|uniref:ATP-dependent Lhr-like helicase n=1 Tax=Quadrisphaera granulorum TaxID=317664 RepID=A0A315ZUB1_9ACTN|nr:DEAD/DEAH box helicase [Quadrisphaera granulorum]PWJ48438.1 ATP-dependent Lhr-like helicase [Quadrisphaera granulorum]SZE98397.1 ATP-dependent helicase Lhr and Lhr-like helicase [Quadrisphaera granulorum]
MEELHPVVQHHLVNTLGWQALRPLQQAAITPLVAGHDALLLAPTAGGKTEATVLPLLSRMAGEAWTGLSVLYVCPLRALLNNLEPRLAGYASWTGRRVGLWHGDTTAGTRRRLLEDLPDLLLTTPESLEAMLVSTRVDHRRVFGDLRVVVVDEVHAFAGDDRGWHLLAVLERLSRVAGRSVQRVGMSATVGNPDELLAWLQGSGRGTRPATVVAPPAATAPAAPDLQVDFVGSVPNAATVVAALHHGEKRLVFADSRRTVEQLAVALRERGTETFVSHSSLSVDERRRAETAFAEARDCVITSTSTLELGIDVGDLDRVLQLGAPTTVASFLQRLGRAGRRAGSSRSMLFLATTDEELLRAVALLLLWSEGYVEPVTPPPSPRHLAAQQLLALCLQDGRVGRTTWPAALGGLPLAGADELAEITDGLLERGYLDSDSGMLFVGREAERRYGHRHFLELLSAFTADPQFTVLHGRLEIGTLDQLAFTRSVEGPRVLSLGGRSWLLTHLDWGRRRAYVEPTDRVGSSRWSGGARALSFALTDAMRRVLLGAQPRGVVLSRRATERLAVVREQLAVAVDPRASAVGEWHGEQLRWWTWAGARANLTLLSALAVSGVVEEVSQVDDRYLRLAPETTAGALTAAMAGVRQRIEALGVTTEVSDEALKQLKFADLLPERLSRRTLSERQADAAGARLVLDRGVFDVRASR